MADDARWVICFIVVQTETTPSNRKVLIPPFVVAQPNGIERVLPLSISAEKIGNSPDIDTERPVSRQHELRHLEHYGDARYREIGALWREGTSPGITLTALGYAGSLAEFRKSRAQQPPAVDPTEAQQANDAHLRSYRAVVGYRIQAIDGELGHVEDLLIDDETWAIRYVVVTTSQWWLGHLALIAPQWIADVSWLNSRVSVNLPRDAIKDAPPYDATVPMDRMQEIALDEHYGGVGRVSTT